jgi:hypothetical protein
MFTSRLFVGLLIPLIILGLGLWVVASANIDKGDVRVAGALISADNIELSVKNCYFTEDLTPRKLVVEVDATNAGTTDISLSPAIFQIVLSRNDKPNATIPQGSIFQPMKYSSICDAAPNSVSSIPPNALRSYTLIFLGESLPQGEEWDNYYIHLEGYDPSNDLAFSKLLNPEGK